MPKVKEAKKSDGIHLQMPLKKDKSFKRFHKDMEIARFYKHRVDPIAVLLPLLAVGALIYGIVDAFSKFWIP